MRNRPGATGGAGEVWALLVIVIFVALRLAYCTQVELLPEEAYYWLYSRHLDIGYLDHPPMVAWLIRCGTALFGQTELGVRVGAIACGVIASGFVFALVRDLFGAPSAFVALVLMQVLPPFFFTAGLLMTPDAPLTAAWSAMLYALERALLAGRDRAWWGVGVALGLGLLSKYTIALLALAALVFVLTDPQARRWLKAWQPYAAALLALLVFSPVILWNAKHHWASFAFQTSRRLGEAARFSLHKLLGSVVVLLTPTGMLALVPLATQAFGRAPASEAPTRAWRFLACAAFVPLLVFALFSLFHEVKLDWTVALWVAAVPAFAAGITGAAPGLERWRRVLRPLWAITIVVLLVVYAGGYRYLTYGLAHLGYGRHPELVPVGWRALALEVAQRARAGARAPLIVGMDHMIASELAFYAPDASRAVAEVTSAHLFGARGLMYELWFPAELQRGRDLLLVGWRPEDLDSPEVRACVDAPGPIEPGHLRRADGQPIRAFYTRAVQNYHGPPCTRSSAASS